MQSQGESLNESSHSSAIRFFRNADLCTHFCEILIKQKAITPPSKLCSASRGTATLLAFRGVTRQAWRAVMLEHPTRLALNLAPRDETVEGIVCHREEPFDRTVTHHRLPTWAYQRHVFISHDEADVAALHARDRDDPSYRTASRPGIVARVATHHPAVSHWLHVSMASMELWITWEKFEICSKVPLAREMFLTQPPQKSMYFWIRYDYWPGRPSRANLIEIENANGLRFEDLAAYIESRPELWKKPIPGGLEQYKRWLRDSEFVYPVRITWEYPRAIERGHYWDEDARLNTESLASGDAKV